MYKLIMNAFSFGKLNEANSFVFDPKTCMTVTVNGQLMLCMLCEWIYEGTKDTKIIQANTDGVALDVPDHESDLVDSIAQKWQDVTGLILEDEIFKFLAIDNVNHYLGQYSDDPINEDPNKLKAKGKYLTKPTWTQDFSTLVIQKAVSAYFKDGTPPEKFIKSHDDPYDFRARIKIDRRFDLYLFNDANGDNPLFKKIGIGDRVSFQRMIRDTSKDIHEVLNGFNDDSEFLEYIRGEIATSKGIDIDDVDEKDINRRFKSIPSRAKFIGEKLAGEYQVHDRIGKPFARYWLDNDKKIDMEPMKGRKLQTVTAYYMAKKGHYMFKETLPTEDNPLRGKFGGVQAGQKVIPCNNIEDFNFDNVNYEWYIHEAWKLITPIMPEKDKHTSPIWQEEQRVKAEKEALMKVKQEKLEAKLAKAAKKKAKKKA